LGVLPTTSELKGLPLADPGSTPIVASKRIGGQNTGSNSKTDSPSDKPGQQATGGIYVGAGLSPVSNKLAQRIRQWEFIDMNELLPEVQLFGEAEGGKSGSKRPTVTDILTWVQCFAVYISVLAPCYPDSIPELMAYMMEIVGQARRF